MRITQILTPDFILAPITAADKEAAVRQLASVVASARGIEPEPLLRDIQTRERAGPAIIPCKPYTVAIPHAASESCKQLLLAIGTSREGIAWGENTDLRANLVFLLLCPPQTRPLHLKILGRLARLCSNSNLVESLVNASSAQKIIEYLAKAEEPYGRDHRER